MFFQSEVGNETIKKVAKQFSKNAEDNSDFNSEKYYLF